MEILPLKIGDELYVRKTAEKSWKYAYKNIYKNKFIEYWIDKYYNLSTIKNDIEKSINNKNPLFYGLFDNNIMAGFIEIDKINKTLLRFYLAPEYIGKGYGTHLLKSIEEIIINEKIESLILCVNQLNFNAIKFYKKNGFKIIKEDNEDYIMEKYYGK